MSWLRKLYVANVVFLFVLAILSLASLSQAYNMHSRFGLEYTVVSSVGDVVSENVVSWSSSLATVFVVLFMFVVQSYNVSRMRSENKVGGEAF